MIIYGSRSSQLRTQNIPGKCPSCQTENSTRLIGYQRYAHIFWIPLFPIGKIYLTECGHCKQALDKKDITEHFRIPFQDFKNQLSTPLWTFAGLGLIAVTGLFMAVSANLSSQQDKEYIANPLSGDVYHYQSDDKSWSTLRVVEVSDDSVFYNYNNYVSNTRTSLEKIDQDSSYSTDVYMLARQELTRMLEEGTISSVRRK